MSTEPEELISHRDRMRRVVLVCCAFARNAAFYRAGWNEQARPLLAAQHPEASFWRQVNSNFFDVAVLDWCKLFGDPKSTPPHRLGKHHWRRVLSDPDEFERQLLARLRVDEPSFGALIETMRCYRDKFVAHLDNDLRINIPELDLAYEAVAFYHCHIVQLEAAPGELAGLPDVNQFARGYTQCSAEAIRVYAARYYFA
jgi:hypothetical protein